MTPEEDGNLMIHMSETKRGGNAITRRSHVFGVCEVDISL